MGELTLHTRSSAAELPAAVRENHNASQRSFGELHNPVRARWGPELRRPIGPRPPPPLLSEWESTEEVAESGRGNIG